MAKCAKAKVQKLTSKTVSLLHSDGTLEDVPVESLEGADDDDGNIEGNCE